MMKSIRINQRVGLAMVCASGVIMVAGCATSPFEHSPAFQDDFDAGWENVQTDWQVATWKQNGALMAKDRCRTDGEGLMVQTVLAGEPYRGGSMQTGREFGFGRWVARVKPSSVPGVLNSIFTKDWDNLATDTPHDGNKAEVDIEFLTYTFGANTGKVHLAIHLKGRSNHFVEDLPIDFNPSDRFREWGFDILPDRVVWHVDGRELMTWMYTEDAYIDEGYEFFFNSWTRDTWIHGPPDEDAHYEIDWVKFYPLAM